MDWVLPPEEFAPAWRLVIDTSGVPDLPETIAGGSSVQVAEQGHGRPAGTCRRSQEPSSGQRTPRPRADHRARCRFRCVPSPGARPGARRLGAADEPGSRTRQLVTERRSGRRRTRTPPTSGSSSATRSRVPTSRRAGEAGRPPAPAEEEVTVAGSADVRRDGPPRLHLSAADHRGLGSAGRGRAGAVPAGARRRLGLPLAGAGGRAGFRTRLRRRRPRRGRPRAAAADRALAARRRRGARRPASACWSTSCPTTSGWPPRSCRSGGGTCCAAAGSPNTPVAFDIDWDVGGGKIRLPMLGDGDDELDALRIEDGELRYYDHRFPIADGTGDGTPREVHGPSALRADELPAGRRRAELPAVLRDQHAGRDPGRAARGVRASRTRRSSRWVRQRLGGRAADRPPGRAGRSGRLPGRPGRADRPPVRAGGEDHRGRRDAAGVLGVRGHHRVRGAGRAGPAVRRPGGRGGAGRPGHPVARRPAGGLGGDDPATKRAVADGILRSEVLRLARLVPDVSTDADGRDRRAAQFLQRVPDLPAARRATTWPRPSTRRCSTRPELGRCDARDRRPARRCRHRVLGPVPADLRHGDGQGRRGLRVLPVDPADLADRGGRRAGAVLADPGGAARHRSANGCSRIPRPP